MSPRVLHRHDDLFQRGVARPLADAVDGALDLPRAAAQRRQRVGDGQAEIVVAVGGEDHPVGIGHALAHGAEHAGVFLRRGVADGVGQVDGRGAGLDRRVDALAQVVDAGAGGIHRRPLDVLDEVARAGNGRRNDLQHLGLGLAHLVRQMDGRGGDERVDAPALGVLHGFAGAVDVGVDGAGEAGHGRVLHAAGDGRDGLEVAVRGDGKTGLDDVDAHAVEALGNLELLLEGHGGAGALLAVAQRGVENDDTVGIATVGLIGIGGHRLLLSLGAGSSGAALNHQLARLVIP